MLLQLSKTVKQSPKSPQIFENNGAFCADRPFSKNRSETNCQKSFVFNQLVSELQSYILSTTTETKRCVCLNDNKNCFNRTSFQQQLKHRNNNRFSQIPNCFNRTSFQQQLKHPRLLVNLPSFTLQSYILSTTTETIDHYETTAVNSCFNRTSFQQQLKPQIRGESLVRNSWLQSYILSTTTETAQFALQFVDSMLQSYILSTTTETYGNERQAVSWTASIVHPFNNN